MTFGVTPDGFNRKTLADILTDFQTQERTGPLTVDPNADTSAETPLGQLNGIVGAALAEGWEALEACYHAMDPEAAEGDALVNVALLTGTTKRGAVPSKATGTLNLNAGATVPSGSLISVNGRPDIVFILTADVTNPGGSPANISGVFESEESGPVQALAGTLTHIVTPISGWNSVTNSLDAELGRFADDTITLRQRRTQELSQAGGSTIDGIAADLLEIEVNGTKPVNDVQMLENLEDHYDPATGLPARSFEALISDDNLCPNDTIAQTIWNGRPAGIVPAGASSGTATDKANKTHTVKFSRATDRNIYIDAVLTVTSRFPDDGEEQVKAAIVLRGETTFGVSDDVILVALEAACLTVKGVTDAQLTIGFAADSLAAANLEIGLRERARFDSTRIVVSI